MTRAIVSLELPYPPTANHSYATVRGRRVLTHSGKAFRAAVRGEVLRQGAKAVDGDLAVHIELCPPDRRRRDIDNPVKPLLDALTKAGLWGDDSSVKRLSVDMRDVTKGGRCSVEVVAL